MKSRSVKWCKKECEKRAGVGERQGSIFFPPLPPPFPSRARLIFALLVLRRPHYTLLSESLAQAIQMVNAIPG